MKLSETPPELYKKIINAMPVGLHVYHLEDVNNDRTLRMTAANDAASQYTGVSIESMIGRTLDENFPGLRELGIPQKYAEVIRTGKSIEIEHISYADDRIRNSDFSVKAIPLPNNCVAVVFDNITERIYAEQALKKREKEFRLLFSEMTSGVALHEIICNENGTPVDYRFLDVNPAFEKLTGLKKEQLVGKTVLNVMPGTEKHWIENYGRVALTGEPLHFENYSGELNKYYEVTAYSPQKGQFAVVFNDVTKNRLAEENLRSAANHWQSTFDSVEEAICVLDDHNLIVCGNRAMMDMTGKNNNQMAGKHCHDIIHHSIESKEKCPLKRLHQIKKRVVYEFQSMDKYFEVILDPLFDDDHNYEGAVHITKDITKRKQDEREKEKLEQQLRQAQKMEAIGTLAGGIAHDFNNILTPILGYAGMMKDSLTTEGYAREDLNRIIKGAERAKDLIKQILTFSRQIEQERKPVKLQEIYQETINLLRSSLPSTIEMKLSLDPNCGPVLADPTQMQQILLNLCTNAFHSMRGIDGILEIKLKPFKVTKKLLHHFAHLHHKQLVRLSIKDTGIGIKSTDIHRIFEPFFTTKKVGEGTGLGLSVVHGIVRNHGGEITVSSTNGRGTIFNVYLPVHDSCQDELTEEVTTLKGNSERILFIDDETAIIKMAERMLTRLGYQITIISDSVEAFDLFQNNSLDYDIIITDLTMPKMNGLQIAKKVKEIRADIPVILITGFGDVDGPEFKNKYNVDAIILKPLVSHKIGETIRNVLSGKAEVLRVESINQHR
ncbi:PAS domain S-box protein [candidate division KSB1 bacterium]|nr:PAS domain S-box protein [candidate division KSB1 bacterium]